MITALPFCVVTRTLLVGGYIPFKAELLRLLGQKIRHSKGTLMDEAWQSEVIYVLVSKGAGLVLTQLRITVIASSVVLGSDRSMDSMVLRLKAKALSAELYTPRLSEAVR